MAKKKKLQPGDYIPLTDSQQETLITIFKTYDMYESTITLFSQRFKEEREIAWDAFYEIFPLYKDWNVRWNRKEKRLELLYPKSK